MIFLQRSDMQIHSIIKVAQIIMINLKKRVFPSEEQRRGTIDIQVLVADFIISVANTRG